MENEADDELPVMIESLVIDSDNIEGLDKAEAEGDIKAKAAKAALNIFDNVNVPSGMCCCTGCDIPFSKDHQPNAYVVVINEANLNQVVVSGICAECNDHNGCVHLATKTVQTMFPEAKQVPLQ
jgi:hypothetical protein